MKRLLGMTLSLTLLFTLFTFNTYAANYDFDDTGIVEGDYTTYPVLKKGDTGELVEHLQTWLNFYFSESNTILDVDGSFGSKTKARVKEFQDYYDLSVDGSVGPKTWHALFTIHEEH